MFHLKGKICALIAGAVCAAGAAAQEGGNPAVGTVYTMTNGLEGNDVLVYNRHADGTLTFADDYPTGGFGTGAGLGNQGGVTLMQDGRHLLVVSAGSHEVSVFRVRRNELILTDIAASGGEMPISVTSHGNLVYVLNAGGDGNIVGFELDASGNLTQIADSTRGLSGNKAPGPAQVSFNPAGTALVVTEKVTNLIDVFLLGDDGRAGEAVVSASAGATPFGFEFTHDGVLIVSEAFGGEELASAVSSYSVGADGAVTAISPAVPTNQTAACWIAIDRSQQYAYTTNTGSNTVSGYAIGADGAIELFDDDGIAAETGAESGPLDMAFTRDGRFAYTLNGANGTITGFAFDPADGSLSPAGEVSGIPVGASGLAAR